MTAVPAATPLTVPVEVTVAIVVLPLLQAPPEVASLSGVVVPAHSSRVPLMAAGLGTTVTTVVVRQPALSE